ncbi:hypothetical protein F6453_0003 [Marinobacter nauticus]|uniref:Uncharacterized protein n=1 Tax=Marinobacter nauticus TaxID=2743 RepID=A0A833JSY8_MARNT|nr:hypothetical protein F6453_0003 [Marinobacter nauticus]
MLLVIAPARPEAEAIYSGFGLNLQTFFGNDMFPEASFAGSVS